MAGIGCAILSLGLVTNAFESALYACPAPCHGVPEDWNVYTSADRLQACREPMLLDFALDPAVNLTERVTKLFTCSSKIENANTRVLASSSERQARGPHGVPNEWSHSQSGSPTCFSSQERTLSLDFFMDSTPGSATSNDLQTILDHAQHYLTDVLHCDTTNLFGYYNGATIGIFSGSSIDNARMISSVIWGLHGRISKDQSAKTITLQRCNDLPNADYVFGLAIDMDGDLAAVQKAVTSWSSAECAVTSQASTKLHDVVFHEKTLVPALNRTSTVHKNEHLSKRGDCRTITVVSGDSCSSLASKCGIPANDFNEYNPKENLCSTLTPGQPICCSAGGLPDIRPEPNADGSCASYKVQSGDTCSAIAVSHGLRTSELSEFNDGTTWGWFGCDDLQLGLKICLSTGGPPMPTPVTNAQCGPTVPGTEMPANGTNLLDLNQCPLNACCDIWGQCGITPEYCTNVTGPLGNPGTAPRGQNGCISNCGTNITNDIFPPTNFMKIGYYESWNWERPCLNLRASSVSVVEYSHVHWAFATITDDFDVAINDTYDQWQGFLKLYGVHKVISIGGWDFSTSISTYDKLRRAMEPANVDAFVDKIFNFVEKNGLNGIDVDWEYPGVSPSTPNVPR